jgi:hypothetical protein
MTHTFNRPDFAMFGLAVEDMREWVADLCRVAAAGTELPDETLLDDSVIDIPVLLRLIDESCQPRSIAENETSFPDRSPVRTTAMAITQAAKFSPRQWTVADFRSFGLLRGPGAE